MIKTLLRAAVILSVAATPALAGSKSMKGPDGSKLSIKCDGGGCKVREKKPDGKWKTVQKTAGGTENYEKLLSDYTSKGYK